MAECHQILGNLEAAVSLYKSVLEVKNEDMDTKFALAELYEEMGEPELAKELADEGILCSLCTAYRNAYLNFGRYSITNTQQSMHHLN